MRNRRLRSPLLALPLLLAAGLWACGDDDPVDPGENEVVIINLTESLTFSDDDVTISPGTTVRWVNQSTMDHTATPDGHSEWTRWATTEQGEDFVHTFNTVGEFPYFCEPHLADEMTGIIRVE